jgi:two-component system, LytTR family, sensor histidine kinase AlgZ
MLNSQENEINYGDSFVMDHQKFNSFIFSSRFSILRHVIFWIIHVVVISFIYAGTLNPKGSLLGELLLISLIWVPAYILYAYPVMYVLIPSFLLKHKYGRFILLFCIWAVAGWFFNYLFRSQVLNPFREYINASTTNSVGSKNPWAAGSYFNMNMMAGFCSMIVLFKYWYNKQRDWMQAEKEKVTVELQLLKAQVHPHFLFNTLNNIYSFSMENSPKTADLILKLSSLLNYMLYDCKAEKVPLEKEIAVMKDYIDLEKERYANKLEISLNIEGDINDKFIVPLLLLPLLENAFKHGTSEQLEKPWLSMDLSVRSHILRCKIVNSKNDQVSFSENGIGINNVKKRLQFLYPGKHELKTDAEPDFFVASLTIDLGEDFRSSIPNKKEPSLVVN